MAIKDIRSKIQQLLAFFAAISSNTTTNGAIIDTADFEMGLMFAMAVTAFTDGSYELQIFESDDSGMSGETQVTGDKLIGAAPTLTAATASGAVLSTVGVISNKRYVRCKVVSTGVTTGADVAVIASEQGELEPVV